jgi:hypothetical protein
MSISLMKPRIREMRVAPARRRLVRARKAVEEGGGAPEESEPEPEGVSMTGLANATEGILAHLVPWSGFGQVVS